MASSSSDLSEPDEPAARCHTFTLEDVHQALSLSTIERFETPRDDVEQPPFDAGGESCSASGVGSSKGSQKVSKPTINWFCVHSCIDEVRYVHVHTL